MVEPQNEASKVNEFKRLRPVHVDIRPVPSFALDTENLEPS